MNEICKERRCGRQLRKGELELFVLNEAEMKWKGKILLCGELVKEYNKKYKEPGGGAVAVLMNDAWYSAVVEFECVSCKIIWVKLMFARVFMAHGSSNEMKKRRGSRVSSQLV